MEHAMFRVTQELVDRAQLDDDILTMVQDLFRRNPGEVLLIVDLSDLDEIDGYLAGCLVSAVYVHPGPRPKRKHLVITGASSQILRTLQYAAKRQRCMFVYQDEQGVAVFFPGATEVAKEIYLLLTTGPATVGDLTVTLGKSRRAVSHSLDKLLVAGLVADVGRRCGSSAGRPSTSFGTIIDQVVEAIAGI